MKARKEEKPGRWGKKKQNNIATAILNINGLNPAFTKEQF